MPISLRLVLTPWGSAYYSGGLLTLTAHPHPDGTATAIGQIIGPASFQ